MRHEISRMNIVRKDEKENKLKDFMQRHLNALGAPVATVEADAEGDVCYVVARSSESPVAKVLLSLLPEFSARNIAIKALYAMPGREASFMGPSSPWAPPRIECRRAGDMRLLEAHELLILGPQTAWVGDCMRREPSQGDAYEFYADDCHDMAAAALRSFNRLWAIAKPFRPRVVSSNPLPHTVLAPLHAGSDMTAPVSFSRH